MRRTPLFVTSAAASLILIGGIGWIKWKESASDNRLREEIQKGVFNQLGFASTDLKPSDIRVDITEKRFVEGGYANIVGTVTIPRKPFTVQDPSTGRAIAFRPDGQVKGELDAYGTLKPEKAWLGVPRPTWGNLGDPFLVPREERRPSLIGETYLIPAWIRAPSDPDNAVFDAHLAAHKGYNKGSSKDELEFRINAILLVVVRALQGLGRTEEAMLLIASVRTAPGFERAPNVDLSKLIEQQIERDAKDLRARGGWVVP